MINKDKVIGGLELLAHWPGGLIITDKEKWIKPCCEMAIALLKEQEPKTGRWIFESRYNDIWSNICSECGRLMTTATGTYANYCSNCGAKMMGGEKKDDID